jgi:anti-sigma regulatory factor (Ser/Thr protein kinase)
MPATTAATTGRAQPCPDPPRPTPDQPRRAFLNLGAVLTSPRDARAWTREILWEWQLADLADDAEAVVAELVGNAAVHASAGLDQPVIRLALVFGYGELAILVRDDNPVPPQPQQPAEDALSGRGLLMVEVLSDRYGWYPIEGGTAGKVVWAVLRTLLMYPATTPPSASPSKAPAWPENDQPDDRRGPLIAAGHAGRSVTKGTRPMQELAPGPRPLRLAAAEGPGADVNDHAPSRPVPPAPPAAGATARIS